MGEIEIFGKRLRSLRENLGMTQMQFSEHIGIRQQTLSGYENGRMKPPLDVAVEISEKCDVSLDWLCGLSDRKSQSSDFCSYADILEILVKVDNQLHFSIYNNGRYESGNKVIDIGDSIIQKFLYEWSELLGLYHNGTISRHLYELWIRDKLLEYDVPLHDQEAFHEFLDLKFIEEDMKPDK